MRGYVAAICTYMYVHSKWKMNQKIYLVFIKNFHYIFSCPETFWSPCGCLLVHVHFTSCRHEPLPLPSPPCWTQIFYPMNKSTSKYWPWLTTFFSFVYVIGRSRNEVSLTTCFLVPSIIPKSSSFCTLERNFESTERKKHTCVQVCCIFFRCKFFLHSRNRECYLYSPV